MKKQILNVLAASAVITAFTACGDTANKKQSQTVKISAASSAEELALAGEQLIGLYSFHLADKVFDQAIKAEPTNKRALFYKNILRPLMTTKGLITRLKGFKELEQNLDQTLQEIPRAPLKEFLVKSDKKAITNDVQAQDYLVEVRDAFIESSRNFKKQLDWDLELNLNPMTFANEISSRSEAVCTVNYGDNTKLETSETASMDISEFPLIEVTCDEEAKQDLYIMKINTADILSLQNYYAGLALYLTPYTSYSAEGLQNYMKAAEASELSIEESRKLFYAEKNFMTLRKDHSLAFINEMGSGLISAAKWAMKYQDRLCSKTAKQLRKGHAVGDICIPNSDVSELDKSLEVAKAVLSGPYSATLDNGQTVVVNAAALWTAPIKDLRAALPVELDNCGHAKKFDAAVYSKLLPQDNINDLLVSVCE